MLMWLGSCCGDSLLSVLGAVQTCVLLLRGRQRIICVCVCVRARERERERVCVSECACVCEMQYLQIVLMSKFFSSFFKF